MNKKTDYFKVISFLSLRKLYNLEFVDNIN